MRHFFHFITLLLPATCLVLAIAQGEELFPVGPQTKAQIDFWKKIYTEIHDDEGLIHDSEDLTIVYQKIHLPDLLSPRQQQHYIDHLKGQVENLLLSIAHKGGTQLSATEEELYTKLGRPRPEVLKSLKSRLRFQRGQREKFYQGLKQSQLYLPHIQQILAAWGVPQDLAFLPHVESSFNFQAYSKVGAAGIWQFMRSSAQHYRLKINDLFDERRDPLKSTIAAARMLKFNFQKLKSWPLAITAYNHGVNSMMRAMNQIADPHLENISRHYRNKRYGFASKNFYPCFMAAREIALNPEKYFPELKHEAPLKPLQVVKIGRPYTLREVMRITGISQKVLKRLNPGLKDAVFAPTTILSSKDALILPAETSFTQEQIAQLRLPNTSSPKTLLAHAPATATPVVASSELLAQTSAARPPARRWNQWWHRIKSFLGFKDAASDSLASSKPARANTILLAQANTANAVPAAHASLGLPEAWKAALNDVTENNEVVAQKFNLTGTIQPNGLYQIQVEPSETLGHYRDWSEIDQATLQRLNHLQGTQVTLGQKFLLPLNQEQIARFELRRHTHHQVLREDFLAQYLVAGWQEYVVQAGDTLGKIMAHFSLSLWPLKLMMPAAWNGKIYPGQKLWLPQLQARP